MKVFLLLNGDNGWQTGIEDGFSHLAASRQIQDLRWLYLEHTTRTMGAAGAMKAALAQASEFNPDMVVIFHIGKVPITDAFLADLKNLPSRPILVYDEGDMYGTWAKPITASMRVCIRRADAVSLRGLGVFARDIARINDRIFYTPHHADIARFDREPYVLEDRENEIVLIGNRIKSRYLGLLRRMPGSWGRERFVRHIGKVFGPTFVLHGSGWGGFAGNRGPVGFQNQLDVYRRSWITVAYEHYPKIPYYFSNRLPIAMMAGSLYVCHAHGGYEDLFRGTDFIFLFRDNDEAVDAIRYVLSLDKSDRLERGRRAREFALRHFHPHVVWRNFLYNAIAATGR